MKMDNAGDGGQVYLIRPRMGGLANDVTIEPEGGPILYHVRSKVFAPLGRQYSILDPSMKEILRTEQDHTLVFPSHTVIQEDRPIGRVGQVGIIPQLYFVELGKAFHAELHVGGSESIYRLHDADKIFAEIAQHRSTWIVVISSDRDRLFLLSAIAILYRENTIGG
jgi:hypothetical protein